MSLLVVSYTLASRLAIAITYTWLRRYLAMKALIKFGAFGQYTILVPIDTLGCVDGVLVRGFGYTELGLSVVRS